MDQVDLQNALPKISSIKVPEADIWGRGREFCGIKAGHGTYWRVEMTWPDHRPRYFGQFNFRREAEEWIAEYA
jgi:hypothetical protein